MKIKYYQYNRLRAFQKLMGPQEFVRSEKIILPIPNFWEASFYFI